jgi:hypothetical protein
MAASVRFQFHSGIIVRQRLCNFSFNFVLKKFHVQQPVWLQHNMWVVAARTAVLSVITGGKWVEIATQADPLYQHLILLPNENSGAASKVASPLGFSVSRHPNLGSRQFASST